MLENVTAVAYFLVVNINLEDRSHHEPQKQNISSQRI